MTHFAVSLLGIAGIVYGVWLWNRPLAYIVAGLFAILIAEVGMLRKRKSDERR